jgi:menaquinone-dependent protoporphyrinogen oxidase
MRHLDILRSNRLSLFICGMIPDQERQEQELRKAFPSALQESARSMAFLGGAFVQEKLNLFEKLIVLFISKTRKSQEKIEEERIGPFLEAFLAP